MRHQPTVISILNQKGGVAKTTTTANLGSCLALAGHRTLLIDLDPQANLTLGMGVRPSAGKVGMHDLLQRKAGVRLDHILEPVNGLSLTVAPASFDLALAEAVLTPVLGSGMRLKQALEPHLHSFDFVLIDCPPSLGRLTEMAVVASTHLLVPCEPKLYSFAGMDTLNRMVRGLQEDLNIEARLLGVLLTMYEKRTRLHRLIAAEVRTQFGDMVFDTPIRRTVKVSESELEGKAAVAIDASSSAARDYQELAAEVLNRLERHRASLPDEPRIDASRQPPFRYPLITTPPDVLLEADSGPVAGVFELVDDHPRPAPAPTAAAGGAPLATVVSETAARREELVEAIREDLILAEGSAEVAVNGRPTITGRFGEYIQQVARKLTRKR